MDSKHTNNGSTTQDDEKKKGTNSTVSNTSEPNPSGEIDISKVEIHVEDALKAVTYPSFVETQQTQITPQTNLQKKQFILATTNALSSSSYSEQEEFRTPTKS